VPQSSLGFAQFDSRLHRSFSGQINRNQY